MRTTEAPGPDRIATARHPVAITLLWAAAGYALGAALWVVVAAGVVAGDTAESAGDAVVWFLSALGVIGIVAAGAAVLIVPLMMVETMAWRLVVLRYPSLEADHLGTARSSAVLALPWALFNPLDTPWSSLISYSCAFFGLFAARVLVGRLRPGALLASDGPEPAE